VILLIVVHHVRCLRFLSVYAMCNSQRRGHVRIDSSN
jgi:hypothetical protein